MPGEFERLQGVLELLEIGREFGLDSVERAHQKALKNAKTGEKDAVKLRDLLERVRAQLNEADQNELLGTVQEEAERLNHFIANLLDMTRLESGAVTPHRESVDVGDVVA